MLDLNHVREFLTLSESGEISTAARRLSISQSTLSKHLMQLEMELGSPLFDRSGRGVQLNRYGRLFLPYAQQLVDEQDDFFSQLSNLNGGGGNLNVGFISSLPLYGGLALFQQFREENPDVGLSLQEKLTSEVRSGLEAGELDFAFFNEYGEGKPDSVYERLPLLTDRMAVALPVGHPLSAHKTLTLHELADEQFVMWSKDTLYYRVLLPCFYDAGLLPKISTYSHIGQHIQGLISQGNGISFLLKHRTQLLRDDRIVLVDLEPPIYITLCMFYRRSGLSAQGERFLEFMRENARKLSEVGEQML